MQFVISHLSCCSNLYDSTGFFASRQFWSQYSFYCSASYLSCQALRLTPWCNILWQPLRGRRGKRPHKVGSMRPRSQHVGCCDQARRISAHGQPIPSKTARQKQLQPQSSDRQGCDRVHSTRHDTSHIARPVSRQSGHPESGHSDYDPPLLPVLLGSLLVIIAHGLPLTRSLTLRSDRAIHSALLGMLSRLR